MSTIEVFADVRCPFTHAGIRRLVDRRAADGGGPTLVVRAWPLELVNDAPLDPAHIADEVDALRDQVTPGLFAGFAEERFSSTSLPALDLTAAAYEVGPEVGERVALAVRHALWEDGLDVADAAVLAAIAAEHGVPIAGGADRERVLGDWREGVERGVIGSPHFFVGDAGFFCPGLDISHDDQGFHISAKAADFEAFAERALRPSQPEP